jgi:K+-sensing histidine kinase KdpD
MTGVIKKKKKKKKKKNKKKKKKKNKKKKKKKQKKKSQKKKKKNEKMKSALLRLISLIYIYLLNRPSKLRNISLFFLLANAASSVAIDNREEMSSINISC